MAVLKMCLHRYKQEIKKLETHGYTKVRTQGMNCLILVIVGHGGDYSYDCEEMHRITVGVSHINCVEG
jgi:hypothetical protein